jgi:multiple sugar transport system permease protein
MDKRTIDLVPVQARPAWSAHHSQRSMAHLLTKAIRNTLTYLILILVGIFFVLPFAWMLSTSLKSGAETFATPPNLLPQVWEWSNYPAALNYVPFLRYFLNSLIICTASVVGTVLSCSLVAFSLARIHWWGQKPLFVVVLASMMLPFQVTMIPLFIVFRSLGWIGTYAPLIVPTYFGNGFFIFLIRQFFMTIPEDLLDAARIDGASLLRIYWQIMLPLSLPVLSTVALFTFLSTWNDFLGPLIYLTKEEMWTLAIGLRGFQSQHGWKWELLMAAAVVFTLPTFVLYFFVQRFFVRGIVTTGLK